MESIPRRQQAYQYIQKQILSGELPAGSRISELTLAKEIGMSRMPVREAIRQLEVEGLIRQVPRFGTIVHCLDQEEMAELYEVREAIEGFAAERIAGIISEKEVEMLRHLCGKLMQIARELRESSDAALGPQKLKDFVAADLGFHLVIIRATGNRRMMKIISDLRILANIFSAKREPHDLPIIVSAYRYHRRILRAIVHKNGEAARIWMRRHIQASRQLALESFEKRKSSGNSKENIVLALPQELLDELTQIGSGDSV